MMEDGEQELREDAPPADGPLVIDAARAALLHVEHARTDVVNPVNGSAPYSFVSFHGQRIEFHDNPCANSFERDAGSGKAAAYAQKINDALFELAKAAVRNAISSLTVENERLRGALGAIVGGDVPRPVATHWRADARRCKHDKCAHGIAMYEDCSNCTAAFIEAALSPLPATKGEG